MERKQNLESAEKMFLHSENRTCVCVYLLSLNRNNNNSYFRVFMMCQPQSTFCELTHLLFTTDL